MCPTESLTILTQAMEMCTKYTAYIHPSGKQGFQFDDIVWASINQKGDSNNTYCHPGCLWSGVYYVADGVERNGDEAGGHLIFEDSRYPVISMYQPDLVMWSPDSVPQRNQHSVTPKSKMLLMFPSWLRHSVRPHKGD